jgi:hypothetical protein
LPYTAEPGNGAYVFLYYLFLGHLSKWLGLSYVLVLHLARLAGAAFLLLALIRFYDRVFADRPDLYRIAFWLTAIGSGMGWLLVFLGPVPTDFYVAEAYPFLAMFTNPHFPMGLALLLASINLLLNEGQPYRNPLLLLTGLLISAILPFGMVVVILIAFGWLAWTWYDTRSLPWQPVFCLGLLGGPYLLYQFWIISTDPVLAGWNAQNITPSPPIYDFILSFSPALILAPFGVYSLLRMKGNPIRRILIPWFIFGILLVYFPVSIQRRFMLGFYIPTAALAVYGLDFIRGVSHSFQRRVKWLTPALIGLALPTNLFLLLTCLSGILSHSPMYYMTRDEADAMSWIQAETPARALILASPEVGRLIPAFTGRRVLYGHPYETINAAQEEQGILSFFSARGMVDSRAGLPASRNVDYLFYGPREHALGGNLDFSGLTSVYQTGTVQIFSFNKGH